MKGFNVGDRVRERFEVRVNRDVRERRYNVNLYNAACRNRENACEVAASDTRSSFFLKGRG